MRAGHTAGRAILAASLILATAGATAAQDRTTGSHPDHHHQQPAESAPAAGSQPEGAHDHSKGQTLPPFIPVLTDEDRKAAFPDVGGHAVHGSGANYYVLLDRVEWQTGDGATGLSLDTRGWIGSDVDRLWLRGAGDGEEGHLGQAHAHVLYGRHFSRWWDFVAGIRQDFDPGPARTWAAIGVQGLAPYWFEVEATGYVGPSGRTLARFEVEFDLLLTNRLVLQPLVEVELSGRSDPERGLGAGLTTTDAGFRLRYEVRREVAPYVGVTWNRKYGKTAEFAEAAGKDPGGPRLVTGLRLWF
jgi:copper resistance protein B